MNVSAVLTLATTALQIAPQVIAGIEFIHKEAPSATKGQLALDSLNLATAAAQAELPQDADTAGAVNAALTGIIKNLVTAFHASGLFVHKPVPVASPVGVQAAV